jgi:basic membrane protein A
LKDAGTGAIKGGNFTGPTGLAPFHDVDKDVPAALKEFLVQLEKDVQSGKVPTGVKLS